MADEPRSSFWRERKVVLEPLVGTSVNEVMYEAWNTLISDKSIGVVEFKFNDVVMTMRKKDSLLER